MSSRSVESQQDHDSQRSGAGTRATGNCECRSVACDAAMHGCGRTFPSSSMLKALLPSTAADERDGAVREVSAHCVRCGMLGQAGAQACGTRPLHEVLEAETRRIAHSLHDEAGQLLTVVHLKLADISREIPDECQPCLQEVCDLLNRVEMQLRQISHELHPAILEGQGLTPALDGLIDGVSGRTGLSIVLESTVHGRLPAPVETAVYRMVQEALTNVSRHADATEVRIVLDLDGGSVLCAVRDNGVGFDSARLPRAGLGLTGIRERVEALGGRLAVASSPGCGAELALRIPLS